jgi:hypothetical protein
VFACFNLIQSLVRTAFAAPFDYRFLQYFLPCAMPSTADLLDKVYYEHFNEVRQHRIGASSANPSQAFSLERQANLYGLLGYTTTSQQKQAAAEDILQQLRRLRDLPMKLKVRVTYKLFRFHMGEFLVQTLLAKECQEAIEAVRRGTYCSVILCLCVCVEDWTDNTCRKR